MHGGSRTRFIPQFDREVTEAGVRHAQESLAFLCGLVGLGIARRMRWEHDDDGSPRWASVIEQTVEATGIDRAVLVRALTGMLAPLRDLRRASIDGIVAQLEAL